MAGPAFSRSTALVVVDVQNDFADPAGSLSVPGGESVVAAASRLAAEAAAGGATVVLTQDWHPPSTPHFAKDGGVWPVHCVAGTWGSELHPALEVPPEALRVRKGAQGEDGYSGFTTRDPLTGEERPTELDAFLRERGIERLVVVGLATDYCVQATALDGVSLGYGVMVPPEAVAAVDLTPGDGAGALERMRAAGVDVA